MKGNPKLVLAGGTKQNPEDLKKPGEINEAVARQTKIILELMMTRNAADAALNSITECERAKIAATAPGANLALPGDPNGMVTQQQAATQVAQQLAAQVKPQVIEAVRSAVRLATLFGIVIETPRGKDGDADAAYDEATNKG